MLDNKVKIQNLKETITTKKDNDVISLNVVHRLLEKFHSKQIIYCHWKSNEHVREGMLGLTDLDILVDKKCYFALQTALSEAGYKRFNATPNNGYPAVEDYLAMDENTGKLIHLHLHYQLVAGIAHLKGTHLPWEDTVLNTGKLDKENGIYVVDPNVEMILLLVRAALKIRNRDYIFEGLGKKYFKGDLEKEFFWLKKRIDNQKILAITTSLLKDKKAALLLQKMVQGEPTLKQLGRFSRTASTLHIYRTYHPSEARIRRWVRELLWALGVINKRYLHAATPLRRIPSTGGLFIALMGCDGSGKSTQMKAILKWLSWKIDVMPIYFGSGDGPSSLLRKPFNLVARLIRDLPGFKTKKSEVKSEAADNVTVAQFNEPLLRKIARIPWGLVLAYEKCSKIRKATKARNRGMIVVSDRYPQNQIMGFNDGPLISYLHDQKFWLFRKLADLESTPYRWAELNPPDVVIKLDINPKAALARKPDADISEYQRRVAAIKQIHFPESTKVVQINAEEPLEVVQLKIKKAIWESL